MSEEIKETQSNTAVTVATSSEMTLSSEMSNLLAQSATEQSSVEVSTTPFISVKGKKFTVNETKLGTSIKVVILSTAFDNAYYDRKYDPDVITPPACFSLSLDGVNMVPHPTSPAIQHETCKGCPNNEYGTAESGKGKACKNGRRLLLAAVNDNNVELGDLAILRLPPTSLKPFANYVKSVTLRRKKPLWAMITTLMMDEDSDWPVIMPSYDNDIHDENMLKLIYDNLSIYEQVVTEPYVVEGYEPPNVEQQAAASSRKSKMS